MRPPPSRVRLARAIALVRADRGEALIPDDITLDGAYAVVGLTDMRRDRRDAEGVGYELRPFVRETAGLLRFDPGRRYAYELVAMRYYSITSQLARRMRQRKRRPKKPLRLAA